jgi:hypothetical protein
MQNGYPETLLEAVRVFSDPGVCQDFMVQMRWPDGVVKCPQCGRDDPRYLENARVWECRNRHPRKKFSIKVGTIFEDSPIPLTKWLPVCWMIANDKNGISSYEIHRAVGVTQKSAWFMLQRVRLAMRSGNFTTINGEVEVDGSYVGGVAGNMHKSRRARIRGNSFDGRRFANKTIVMGLLDRHGPDGHSVINARSCATRASGRY